MALALATRPVPAKEQETKPPPPPPESDGTTTRTFAGGRPGALLSGTLIRQSSVTTSWFLYPGACTDRASNTWSPSSSPVADSLNTYSVGSTGSYTAEDQSLKEILWHVVSSSVPATERPSILEGTRSLWCGKYDPGWVRRVGYPNVTYQILYVNTGTHASTYTLTLQMNVSAENGYDFLHLVGGGAGASDPLGNSRVDLDAIIATGMGGPDGTSRLLVTWTGSVSSSTPGAASINTVGGAASVVGSDSTGSGAVSVSISVASGHRALYFVFRSEEKISSEDGIWPHGNGAVLDQLATSDNGSIYTDQAPDGGTDVYGGNVILGSPDSPTVSARVPPGVGTLWHLVTGASKPTGDFCAAPKASSSDRFFEASDVISGMTLPGTHASIVSCTFPIAPGTASVVAFWSEYSDLPRGSGLVGVTEYRVFRTDAWSGWKNADTGLSLRSGSVKFWRRHSAELSEASQADSVQVRFTLQCVPLLAGDYVTCGSVTYGTFFDDLGLLAVSGTTAPSFGIYPGGLAQSTFVDGTMTGANCTSAPCWPGVRGSDLPGGLGIHDNVNAPLGDSLTLNLVSSLRPNGMGINWKRAYDPSVNGGRTIAHTNNAYNSAYDTPRMIFRLFDPTTKSWSPFDSTELDANAVTVGVADTIVTDGEYRVVWPPRDKVQVGAGIPGGFTVNGINLYAALSFLPRGARLQYYFKAVDINGGTVCQLRGDESPYETEDLPLLPGGSIRAPDIFEFRVLPGVYAPGSPTSLLAARTDTPILNLDGAYTLWGFGQDPVTAALRGIGVRADRYRTLQVPGGGNGIGGRELAGQRRDRENTHFPNLEEYAIKDSLARWYRIMIQSSHARDWTVLDEQDARLVKEWWDAATGTGANQGDRCLLVTGDNLLNTLHHPPLGYPGTHQADLAVTALGVADAASVWGGATTTLFPTIDDRFAAASAGPSLAPALTFTYPVDGGCPGVKRFDTLTKVASSDAQNAVFFPNGEVAGIARMSERDVVPDNDRNKGIGYAFSIQYIRQTGIPTNSAGYHHSGLENRIRVLYKFLTSCRGARSAAPGDTGKCWPCPGPGTSLALMQANWAAQGAGFQTNTYGPLYPIQDHLAVTAVEEPVPGTPPHVNALGQNRPNPFNPETTIPYSLARAGRVVIRVFDISGRLIRTLVDRNETAGLHLARWNGRTDAGDRVASGVYFYRITYPDGAVSARKMMILR